MVAHNPSLGIIFRFYIYIYICKGGDKVTKKFKVKFSKNKH